jgi:hypothetical protein
VDPRTIVERSERTVFRELVEGGGVLLHLDSASYHGVNEIGALIWSLISDGGISFERLMVELRARLEDAPSSLEADVTEFVESLNERELIRLSSPAAS